MGSEMCIRDSNKPLELLTTLDPSSAASDSFVVTEITSPDDPIDPDGNGYSLQVELDLTWFNLSLLPVSDRTQTFTITLGDGQAWWVDQLNQQIHALGGEWEDRIQAQIFLGTAAPRHIRIFDDDVFPADLRLNREEVVSKPLIGSDVQSNAANASLDIVGSGLIAPRPTASNDGSVVYLSLIHISEPTRPY